MKEIITIIKKKITGKSILLPLYLFTLLLFVACARMGSPDGGWYDDTPPHVVSSTPEDQGVNAKTKKVTINFNEYISF